MIGRNGEGQSTQRKTMCRERMSALVPLETSMIT